MAGAPERTVPPVQISRSGRYLPTSDGDPLGFYRDTAAFCFAPAQDAGLRIPLVSMAKFLMAADTLLQVAATCSTFARSPEHAASSRSQAVAPVR